VRMGQPATAQLYNRHGGVRGDRTRAYPWPRGRVTQARLVLDQVTADPLTYGRDANAVSGGRCSKRQLAIDYVLDHFKSTDKREAGILVDVHSAELLKDAEWVAPSSLSDSVRMNSNNVLKLHT
jgi:hypothetical protein